MASVPAVSKLPGDAGRARGVVFASTVGNMLSVTPAVTAIFGVFLVAIAGEFG